MRVFNFDKEGELHSCYHKLQNREYPKCNLCWFLFTTPGQPVRDCPGRGNTSLSVEVSSNCLLLRPAVFHTVHYSQPGGLRDQTDCQQGHSVPLLSLAVVVGCKHLQYVMCPLPQVTATRHVMQSSYQAKKNKNKQQTLVTVMCDCAVWIFD